MIANLPRRLAKLRGRSPTELRVRSAQALAALHERLRPERLARLAAPEAVRALLAAGAPTTPEALLDAVRHGPPFLPGVDDAEGTALALRARCPEHVRDVVRCAEAVLAGRFDLLGYRGISFGAPIDWTRDPLAGVRAPALHWSAIDFLDPRAVGDHKLVWELNRQQYLVTLGQAFVLTGESRFADAVVAHVEAWIDANPPKRGVNWASSLELAFRSMSWLWALRLVARSPALSARAAARMLALLHVQAEHVRRYLSTYFSPNTHLTGEALGLTFVGRLAPWLRGAAEWRARGEAILEAQRTVQVRSDGGYFEQATQYHRYTTEFYLQLAILQRAQDGRLAAPLRETVSALFDALLAFTGPDGRMPLLGDDDGGRLVQLDARTPEDVRGLAAAGAVLLERPDLAWVGRDEPAMAVWLHGAAALPTLDRLARLGQAPATSVALAASGFVALRDGWTPEADHALLDAGPHGVLSGAHSHADALALTLAVDGRPLFVDAGTFTYPGPERDAHRGAAAHNVVTLDDRGGAVPAATPFQWLESVPARVTAFAAGGWFDVAAARLEPYAGVPAAASHERLVLRLDRDCWLVHDRVEAAEGHELALRWHLAAGLEARPGDDGLLTIVPGTGGRAVARVHVAGPGVTSVEDGWVSPQYGARTASRVITRRAPSGGCADLLTVVVPGRRAVDALKVEALGSRGCRVALALSGDGHQAVRLAILLPGPDGSCAHDRLRVEGARLAVVRSDTDGRARDVLLCVGDGRGRLQYEGGPASLDWAEAPRTWGARRHLDGAWVASSGPLAPPFPPGVPAHAASAT